MASRLLHPLSIAPAAFDAGRKIEIVETVGGSVGALTAVYARLLRVFEEIQRVVSGSLHALKNGLEKMGCPTSNVGHSTSEKLRK